jgi:hypothetical protein
LRGGRPFDARRPELSGEPFMVVDHVAAGLYRRGSDFSVSANGVLVWRTQSGSARQLVWFDPSGKQVEGLDVRDPYYFPNLSPDANRIADFDRLWLFSSHG